MIECYLSIKGSLLLVLCTIEPGLEIICLIPECFQELSSFVKVRLESFQL